MSGVWDPVRMELDADPPRDPELPVMSYVVCSTPRSGSGLLCRGLASRGLGGVPAEYFNVNQRAPLSSRWGTGDSLPSYVAALRARRSSPAGVFGTKLHADQLEQLSLEALGPAAGSPAPALSAAFLERLLPNLRYVRIVRLDVDRQAISLWTALHSGVWSVRDGPGEPSPAGAPYDFDGIERCRRMIVDGDVYWDRFLRFNELRCVDVVYEQLEIAFAETVAAVLSTILETAVDPSAIAVPDSRRQSDARSEELLARFTADGAEHRGKPLLAGDGATSVLAPGKVLSSASAMASPSGEHQLVLTPDGRLVLNRPDDARWSTPANGRHGAHLVMRDDGDLVLLDGGGHAIWNAGTAGHPGARFELQDDGTLVVRSVDDEPLWHAP
jgi:LPS sulfotransferase NodH